MQEGRAQGACWLSFLLPGVSTPVRWNSLLRSLFSTARGTRNTSVDKGAFSPPCSQGSPERTQRWPSWASSACERLHSARCAVRHPLLSLTLSVSQYRAHSFQKIKLRVRNTRGCSQEFTEQADRIRLSARLSESGAGQTHSLSSKCCSVPSLRPSRDSAGCYEQGASDLLPTKALGL